MLVPDIGDIGIQVIAVSDLARWLLDAAEAGVVGTYNAVGDAQPFPAVVGLAAATAGSNREQVGLNPHGDRGRAAASVGN